MSRKEQLTEAVIETLTDSLFNPDFPGMFTCGEAETFADWLRAHGHNDAADRFMRTHAEHDVPGDAHYDTVAPC
jgi:hypothetical protein